MEVPASWPLLPQTVRPTPVTGAPSSFYDDQSLAYRERGNPRELEESPRVVLLYRDSATGTGWKFRCTAEVHRDGPVNDDVIARLSQAGLIQDPRGDGCAVVLRVDQVLTLFGEVLQQRGENLDW